jgi:hypothetical protein
MTERKPRKTGKSAAHAAPHSVPDRVAGYAAPASLTPDAVPGAAPAAPPAALLDANAHWDALGLRDLLGLAVMAVEADRVLCDLDVLQGQSPELRRWLGEIEAWRSWIDWRGKLGGALAYMESLAVRVELALH